MAATVNPATIGASVSSAYPRVSASIAVAQSGVNYVLPAFAVEYVAVQVSAELDVRGQYKFVADAFAVLDAKIVSFIKGVADQVAAVDASILSLGKTASDVVVPEDVLLRAIAFVRSFEDTAPVSDAFILGVIKSLADLFVLTDSSLIDLSKIAADQANVVDILSSNVNKPLSDFIGAADVADIFSANSMFFRSFYEGISTSDSNTFSIDKFVFDSAAVTDAIASVLTKTIIETALISDVVSITSIKQFAETQSVEDVGYILSQSYCDYTYLAEDYVGTSIIFT